MRSRGRLAVSLVLLFVLSGCAGPGDGDPQSVAAAGTITVIESDGSGLVLLNDTGAILGVVQDDVGVKLVRAHVALLGTDANTYSNITGSFRLLNVSAGTYTLRVDHPDYRTAEHSVEVKVGVISQLTVVLVPNIQVGAGYRPHLHDYWEGRTEVTVMDRAFDWHEPYDDSGPYSETFGRYYDTLTLIGVHPCVWTEEQDEVYFNQRQIWFDDPSQLVWAGTSRIEVALTWTQQDYIHDVLAFAYRSADATTYVQSPMIKKGEPYIIEVAPQMVDSSHQTFSLWDFWVCTGEESEFEARPFLGSVQVSMKLARGHPILPEAAHPYFWANGTEVPVLQAAQKNFSAGSYALSRSQFGNGAFVLRPGEGVLVPPGTDHLVATLEWAYELPANNKPWSLTYRPANVYPFSSKDPATLTKPTATATSDASRMYVIPLKAEETDAFYQKKSNWVFFLNLEGEEHDWKFVNPCPCAIQVKLTVMAVKADDFEAEPAPSSD